MPSRDVNLVVRAQGARRASRDIDLTAGSVTRLGRASRGTSGHVRVLDMRSGALGRTMGFMGRQAVYAGTALLGLSAVVGKRSYSAYTETMKVAAQTNAVIKSTGGVAGVTAQQVDRLSTSISRRSGIDDEAIQRGANLLLTFTNLRNETGRGNRVFDRATGVITDMSAALDQDLKSSAIQVGKALQDPVLGMTALRRVGVNFSADQQEQVKRWVKHGQLLKAQKFILRELGREFGGSAAAQATAGGKLSVAWGNVEEAIGKVEHSLLDQFGPPAVKMLEGLIPKIQHLGDVLGDTTLPWDKRLETIGSEFESALKRAKLGEKLENAFRWAGPKVANALWQGFKEAPIWAKVVGVGFLLTRLGIGGRGGGRRGPFGLAGSLAAATFRGGFDAGLTKLSTKGGMIGKVATFFSGRGSTPTNPLYVLDVGGGLGGGALGKGSKVGRVARIGARLGPLAPEAAVVAATLAALYAGTKHARSLHRTAPAGRATKRTYLDKQGFPTDRKHAFSDIRPGEVASGPHAGWTAGSMNEYLGHMASGGIVAKSGYYEVGEHGRERVFLPQGSNVKPDSSRPAPQIIQLVVDGKVLASTVHRQALRSASTR